MHEKTCTSTKSANDVRMAPRSAEFPPLSADHETITTRVECGACDGYGITLDVFACADFCERCGGTGSLVLDLPVGFDSGDVDEAIANHR
jgi:DnaJ-class molecular chaperone